jgi:hypothetical protein
LAGSTALGIPDVSIAIKNPEDYSQ